MVEVDEINAVGDARSDEVHKQPVAIDPRVSAESEVPVRARKLLASRAGAEQHQELERRMAARNLRDGLRFHAADCSAAAADDSPGTWNLRRGASRPSNQDATRGVVVHFAEQRRAAPEQVLAMLNFTTPRRIPPHLA